MRVEDKKPLGADETESVWNYYARSEKDILGLAKANLDRIEAENRRAKVLLAMADEAAKLRTLEFYRLKFLSNYKSSRKAS